MVKNEISKLKALSDIASIDITLDFEEILTNILKIMCEAVHAHSGTIVLIDENNKELKMAASYGLPSDYIDRVYDAARKAGVELGSSPSGIVLETGKLYTVPDVYKEPRAIPWRDLGLEIGISSQLFLPMKRHNNVIGLLNVFWAKPRKFEQEEIDFTTIAASQASSIVENARLCSRLRGNVHELKEYKENLEEKLEEKHRELFESERYLSSVITSSLDGILVMDEKGKFEFLNDSALNILGWPKEELIGQFFLNVVPQDNRDFIMERWNEIQNQIERPYETRIITKEGDLKYIYVSHAGTEILGKPKYVVVFKDISEYKKLLKSLEESEEKYRDLFENANDPMYTIDTSGHFQSMNKVGLQTLGGTKEEIIGSYMSSFLTPESYSKALEILKKQITCQPYEQPIRLEIICRNGEHRWGDFTTRVMKDGGEIIGVHGIARDITEKKKLEEQLRESESKYRELFENASDIIWTAGINGELLSINNTGLKFFCSTREKILNTHFSKWFTPQSIKIIQDDIEKRLSSISSEQWITLEALNEKGEKRWLETSSRPIIESGEIKGIHGIGRDVTEKIKQEKIIKDYGKKLERAYADLKKSEEKYRELFNNALDAILVYDLNGNILAVNETGVQMSGCRSVKELISTNIFMWLTEESKKIAGENMKKFMQGGSNEKPAVYEIIRKDGSHFWMEFKSNFIKEEDRIVAMQSIGRDVTEKKEMEERLKEYHEKVVNSYEELKEADRLKTEFISNITHELMTPLTSIKGFSELIYNENMGSINQEQRRCLGLILRNSNRLAIRIRDLLDFSNLEKNIMEFKLRPVSINEIIIESVQDMQLKAREKDVVIIQDLAAVTKIRGDKEKLIQVITNVIHNAIKFTPEKGRITIETRDEVDKIKVRITDTGIGIPEDELTRIFDRFYQIDSSSSRKYGGIGLGLSICKGIIEKHHGLIWADSSGNGSAFNILLPKIEREGK